VGLATHLSFPEIGAALFLSPNTVKSQAMSLYRNQRGKPVNAMREVHEHRAGNQEASWESHEAVPRFRREKIRARSRKRPPATQP
jgi:hypothetical protein